MGRIAQKTDIEKGKVIWKFDDLETGQHYSFNNSSFKFLFIVMGISTA
jgi:hypothetical protein